MKAKIVYSDKYRVDIGQHVFPTSKYSMIKEKLEKDLSIINRISFVEPEYVKEEDLLLVHGKDYVDKLKNGTLSNEDIIRLELPFSKELLRSSLLCCGGTIKAVEIALKDRLGIHLGGGFHHSFPDHGEGFCVFNDIAISIKKFISEGYLEKVLVVDCDLHQGNGTAYIFRGEKRVFTFSMHQENNYPFHKMESDLDIGLPDRTRDKEYMRHLEENIPKIISDFKPELIMYVAGADPYEKDKIGNLALTIEGLKKRDHFIFTQGKNFGIPIAVVLAGGYAVDKEDTVNIHYNTIKEAITILVEK